MRKPKYELLRDAYAILGGIPKKSIDLDLLRTKKGERVDCGTICCGIGWLSYHPQFRALGLGNKTVTRWITRNAMQLTWKGRKMDYVMVAQRMFGITYGEASQLFRPVLSYEGTDDKNILLNRIKKLLIDHGQPVDNPEMLPVR